MENIVPNPAAGFTVPVPDLAAMFGGFPQRTITRTFNEVCRAEEALLIQALMDHGAQKGAARTKAAEEALKGAEAELDRMGQEIQRLHSEVAEQKRLTERAEQACDDAQRENHQLHWSIYFGQTSPSAYTIGTPSGPKLFHSLDEMAEFIRADERERMKPALFAAINGALEAKP